MCTMLGLYPLMLPPAAFVWLVFGWRERWRPTLDRAERERRQPVWLALSDLYLDTDPQVFARTIHAALVASRYTKREILSILEWDVAPVCYLNLLDVAGEWAGFDEEALFREIARNRRRVGFGSWFGGWLTLPYARHELIKIERVYGRLPSVAARAGQQR